MRKLDLLFYSVLFTIVVCGGYLFFKYRFDDESRMFVIVLTATGYLSWSLVYHHFKRDLTLALFLEYVVLFGISLAGAIIVQWI